MKDLYRTNDQRFIVGRIPSASQLMGTKSFIWYNSNCFIVHKNKGQRLV